MCFHVLVHQGKQDLEKALKSTLPSLSKIPGARIIVTRDQDRGDCKVVKQTLTELVGNRCDAPILYRVVCRELECWFLGDLSAIEKAFPRFNAARYAGKKEYRDVDKIMNADQVILDMIPQYKGRQYLPKLETASKISPHLSIDGNISTSFRHFVSGIKKMLT
ncbi:MAG: hypothetical protein B6245_08440 [Desulfobacteraceae bacterium 4572_88]|nr:MAG: hypothetical protein B6245_08440 [Desulfobacteraceae bacterium 4572_88]